MSWGSYTLMKCKKCGKVYEVEDSTLIMNLVQQCISKMLCIK